jgi:SAM-dependent methyltransferase
LRACRHTGKLFSDPLPPERGQSGQTGCARHENWLYWAISARGPTAQPMEQRFTSNPVANVYKAARPDYPDALVDDVVSYAGLKPNDAILEVGCSTGEATKRFAARGYSILAIDPRSEMIGAARESLANFAKVKLIETAFEAWRVKRGAFRLVIAAQSWHWLSPEMRFAKAAEVLWPDGSLAVFGHVPVGLPAPLLEQFKQIYLRHTGHWGPPPEAGYLPNGPFKGWFDASGLFGPVDHESYPWKWHHTASSYVNLLRTRSYHRMLAAAKLEQLLDDVTKAIDSYGGAFDADYETHLYMARRLDRDRVLRTLN